jgi:hypothetical protein
MSSLETVLSDLQKRILLLVSILPLVNYAILMEKTRRDRVTVLKSTRSLVRRGYVQKRKVNPKLEKSKLVFEPTLSGRSAAFRLGADLADLLKVEGDEKIIKYLEFVKGINDPRQRKVLVDPLSELVLHEYRGKQLEHYRDGLLMKSLKMGIIDIVNRYDNTDLLHEATMERLKGVLNPDEINELCDHLVKKIDSISRIIETLYNTYK